LETYRSGFLGDLGKLLGMQDMDVGQSWVGVSGKSIALSHVHSKIKKAKR
jgi:hypothetical protein